MKKLLLLSALLLPPASQAAPRLGYITGGPMLHWNFSNNGFRSFSVAFEAAYWSYRQDGSEDELFHNVPDFNETGYGLSVGLEGDWEGIRLYAEPQLGVVYAGLSLGPVLELRGQGAPARLGIQGSGWVNAMAGMDLRYRRLDGKNIQALGLYAKLPALVSGKEKISPD